MTPAKMSADKNREVGEAVVTQNADGDQDREADDDGNERAADAQPDHPQVARRRAVT
jgi:hypothetical protein